MEHYKFLCNHQCEFFPCHKGIAPERFNCLFCYCPLYALGEGCGGGFTYTREGVKDCTHCLIPHTPEGYDYVLGKYRDILALMDRDGRRRQIAQESRSAAPWGEET